LFRRKRMRRRQVVAGATVVGAWIVGQIIATRGLKPTDSGSRMATCQDDHQVKSMIATLHIDGARGGNHPGRANESPRA